MTPLEFKDAINAILNSSDTSSKKRTRVIVYIRVSTRTQAERMTSLVDQLRRMKKFADENNLLITAIFDEVASGRGERDGTSRPKLKAAMKLSLEKERPILVTTCDRFARDISTYQRFTEKGGVLIAAELGLNASELEISVAIRHAQAEGDQLHATTTAGIRRKIAAGGKVGNPNLSEARATSIISRKRNALEFYAEFKRQLAIVEATGPKPGRKVAAAFNKAGFKTAKGFKWKHSNVEQVKARIAIVEATGHVFSDCMKSEHEVAAAAIVAESGGKPVAVIPGGSDYRTSVDQRLANVGAAPEAASLSQRGPFALLAHEHRKLCEMIGSRMPNKDKAAMIMADAGSPRLTREKRDYLLNWMAKRSESTGATSGR